MTTPAHSRSRAETNAHHWPMGYVRAEADGAILEMNPAAADLLARLGPDPIAANLFAQLRLAAPDLRPAFAAARLRGGQITRPLRGRDAAATMTALTEADHTITLFLADDSARMRAEEEAERQRARFNALADAPPDGAVFTLDPHGRVTAWSRSAERLEGLAPPDALGRPLDALFARASFPADAETLIEAAARAGTASVAGVRIGASGATARATLTLRAVRDRRGALDGFIAILRDNAAQGADSAAELRRLADTDPLTGVLNRRAFEAAAGAMAERARRRSDPFAVCVLDIDDFKALNDRRGHAAGDHALRALVAAARDALREADLVARLGGDEFAVALPGADDERARIVAERLRGAIARARPERNGVALAFTVSVGVAAAERRDEPLAALLARADAALYRAKAAGKNRVVGG